MQENQISHVFCTFLLLTEEDMASCSRAFRKPKNAEEVRNLIENAIPKLTRAVINMFPPFDVSVSVLIIN